jgi:hypothetical protein
MAKSWIEDIIILAKTYPVPSARYVETSCVAGINQHGVMRRLYPVPYRHLGESGKFKKWQQINVRIAKSDKDRRPESHKLFVDTIKLGEVISTKNQWMLRREWIEKIPKIENVDILENQSDQNITIALIKPKPHIVLEIKKSRHPDWTDEEKAKLARDQNQPNLFEELDATRTIHPLKKVPYNFYYRYKCDTAKGKKEFKHKINDWEAGALYWNCLKSHGERWENPFREKLEKDLGSKDLMLLMGNQHRFQNQWLIISLIYPPKQPLAV